MSHESATEISHSEDASENSRESSAYAWVEETARNHPVLVVGGALALGALTAIALSKSRSSPSGVRAFEKKLRRQVASAEKTLKRTMNAAPSVSGLSEIPSAMATRLLSWDASQLGALKSRAEGMVEQLAERAATLVRSR